MSVLFMTHDAYLDHEPGRGHPERPARLEAVLAGARAAEDRVEGALVRATPRRATRDELERVHPAVYLDALEALVASGGGALDPDTAASPGTWDAVVLGAGAGLAAIEHLDGGGGSERSDAAFCAVRPPGHHALASRAMGFCLVNNVAVAAAALADRGERVLIVDYDAHHGNGTQDIFWHDPRVTYVSFHQFPLYPGTGRLHDVGTGAAAGTTVNLPMPPGATGDTYRLGFDQVIAPLAAEWQPTWLLISAGFDAHRADPLTDLGLTAGDIADLTADLAALVPAGRRLVFLEGGYDLEALATSTAACLLALAGDARHLEPPSSGGPGREVGPAARAVHEIALEERAENADVEEAAPDAG
jgi:acetoin utilization deacetylase AcuC-like enzyme